MQPAPTSAPPGAPFALPASLAALQGLPPSRRGREAGRAAEVGHATRSCRGSIKGSPLQGFRLVKGQYEPMRPNPGGSLLSQTLGVIFRADGNKLRLTDAATGVPLLRRKEIQQARRQAEEKAAAEAIARRQAEDKAAAAEERSRALEEELARLRRTLGGS